MYIWVLAADVDVPAGIADIFVVNENPTGYSDNVNISMNYSCPDVLAQFTVNICA
ncbi:TPA: hypothetical protein U2I61_003744 [Providencia rettgeri]|nr:hypothetical protein [Providencia rettgeri]